MVEDAARFLVRMIFENREKRLYVDDAVQNQPLEIMIHSTKDSLVRLANALAVAEVPFGYDRRAIVQGLKRARWSFSNAAENVGLAVYMGSADRDWLDSLREEFSEFRCKIKRVIEEYEEKKPF